MGEIQVGLRESKEDLMKDRNRGSLPLCLPVHWSLNFEV